MVQPCLTYHAVISLVAALMTIITPGRQVVRVAFGVQLEEEPAVQRVRPARAAPPPQSEVIRAILMHTEAHCITTRGDSGHRVGG